MKACIFQKQDPVDIPQVETRTLKDVLELPWGFEIYSLLTRWNPLNFARPLPLAPSGYKVLVVGLGPGRLHAGASPDERRPHGGGRRRAEDRAAAEEISGVDALGERVPSGRSAMSRNLRIAGRPRDGGLRRRGRVRHHGPLEQEFPEDSSGCCWSARAVRMFGGVRFGGTLTIDSAFEMGFDHVALCAGAGRPTVIPMKNGLARGVRQASDFLMALQLTGAAKPIPSRICRSACRSW
jgi:hypothetical protein